MFPSFKFGHLWQQGIPYILLPSHIFPPGGGGRLKVWVLQVWGHKNSRSLPLCWRRDAASSKGVQAFWNLIGPADWCNISSIAGIVLNCQGDESTKLKDWDILIHLRPNSHGIWVMTKRSQTHAVEMTVWWLGSFLEKGWELRWLEA